VRAFLKRRHQLLEVDVRFGRLGEQSIHQDLVRAGVLGGGVGVDAAWIARRRERAPAGGRARVRGELIRDLCAAGAGADYCANWSSISENSGARFVDLHDPFIGEATWQLDERPPSLRSFTRDMSLAMQRELF
jgi:hypothetical protein